MIGKRVRVLRGDCYGKTGEVIDLAQNVRGIKSPVYVVWLGCSDYVLLFEREMEVVPCWPDACSQQESR